MIVTVTPNPALDLTYHLGTDLRVGEVNRIGTVSERAGGKGLNVARLLAAHGVPVLALAPVGGSTGDAVRAGLDAAGVPHDLTPIAGATRRTVVVAGAADATGLWEPGPTLAAAEWAALCRAVASHLGTASVLVLSGSLPPGVPPTGYADLVALGRAAGVPVVLDADGDALRHGLAAGPAAVKPNAAELTRLTGRAVTDGDSAVAAVRGCPHIAAGTDVVVSLGTAGLLAVTAEGVWHTAPPRVYAGNATGAGDAAVAALAVGLGRGDGWPARLAAMAAWSAAAAAHPVAGEVDRAVLDELARGAESR